ncbi:MAG: tRNA pseudouridine(38-40) synthase TruA [Gammaproteobacteria bacterium]|nr:tRNA pseudouridine(38-40) synthase TruA [Gammaproteobacteria bacterium]
MRVAMGVEYDGSSFHGWQLQDNVDSVQARLEAAVASVANHPLRVHCAGRTDAGVHATGQVIHFDTESRRSARNWILGTNVNLPPEVNINWAVEVPAGFHARFSARSRRYRYLILNRATRSSLWRDRAVWIHRSLDEKRMQAAGNHLLGRHDFSSYRALGCQAKSPVRTLQRLEVRREVDRITIDVEADGFLHHMVRNIAGVLIAIGEGERAVDWAREVLDHRDRTLGGVTAPPQGLYLVGVGYPSEFGLPDYPSL